jgi:tRNA pseudouridine38-40 synthase
MILSYDGTDYLGWQETRMGSSIEGELKKVLKQILQTEVKLQAASRTDAGVHAEGQVVNFFSDTSLDLERLKYSLNGLLSASIRVTQVQEVPSQFHPTLDATSKEYHYYVCLGPFQLPFHRKFSWHFKKGVNLDIMRSESKFLLGTHDFSAFTNERQDNNVRTLYKIEIDSIDDHRLRFKVSGNKFLYKMMRNLVGTLMYVGCEMLPLGVIQQLIQTKDRRQAGITAPAHGLILKCVRYD